MTSVNGLGVVVLVLKFADDQTFAIYGGTQTLSYGELGLNNSATDYIKKQRCHYCNATYGGQQFNQFHET